MYENNERIHSKKKNALFCLVKQKEVIPCELIVKRQETFFKIQVRTKYLL